MDRLLVAVLGHRNSGKSKTWNTLFGHRVLTGKEQRPLEVAKGTFVNVFLVSGSPEERDLYVGNLISDKNARIVLCSVQYKDGLKEGMRGTFDHFISKGFVLYVQWLNPGYKDPNWYPDYLGLLPFIQHQHSLVSIRDGKLDPGSRVEEIREFIHGWAAARKLIIK
jgi:hypothetical protein